MPQPLSKVMPNASVAMSNVGLRPLVVRPQLGILAATVIQTWSDVELFMLKLFIGMMGGTTDNAATIFLSLETQSAKRSAIQAIASRVLSPKEEQLLAGR